jgi:hypothetical protein
MAVVNVAELELLIGALIVGGATFAAGWWVQDRAVPNSKEE